MEETMYILIAKSLNQETNAAEQQQLEAWLNEAVANRDTYENMKAAWAQTDALFSTPTFNVTAAWEKVAVQTTDRLAEKKTAPFRKWAAISTAAAALLLIVFAIRFFMTDSMIRITANDKMMVVNLPDHSTVRLEAGSTLQYPKTFARDHRNVSLEGKAFFDVVHNDAQPFSVDASTVDVNVLGTSFYLTTDGGMATVTVTTGKVAMTPKDHSDKIILTPGNKGIFKDHQFNIVPDTNFVYYEKGALEFEKASFENILSAIAKVTNATIVSDKNLSNAAREQLIDIAFRSSQTTEQMLDEICAVAAAHWRKEGGRYVVYGK